MFDEKAYKENLAIKCGFGKILGSLFYKLGKFKNSISGSGNKKYYTNEPKRLVFNSKKRSMWNFVPLKEDLLDSRETVFSNKKITAFNDELRNKNRDTIDKIKEFALSNTAELFVKYLNPDIFFFFEGTKLMFLMTDGKKVIEEAHYAGNEMTFIDFAKSSIKTIKICSDITDCLSKIESCIPKVN